MKAIISVKNGTKKIEIIKIKDEMIKNGIEPIFINEGHKVELIKKGPRIFKFDDFMNWYLERNYYTEKTIEIIKRKWEQINEGFNFVIGIGNKDNMYFYGPLKFNKLAAEGCLIPAYKAREIADKANAIKKGTINTKAKITGSTLYCEACGSIKEDILANMY